MHKEELNVCVRLVRGGRTGEKLSWNEGGGEGEGGLWENFYYHTCTHFKHLRYFMQHFSSL